ncbi:mannose-6-phosphate isomerase [Peziza echinospora]|nr:mannose-6-phosphate isomerase [Peziza echinospora]
MLEVPLYRLQCGANSYDWGKLGHTSAAARYASATSLTIDPAKPYAELWMGTHPSNPSLTHGGRTPQQPLLSLLHTNAALIGPSITEKFGENNLPFLFKVLSIGKALSIQAHPDKALAERLHARDPKNYPDGNHKPEMAVAVTEFDGFCGFRPVAEIVGFLEGVPEFRSVVGEEVAREFVGYINSKSGTTPEGVKGALKKLYATLMRAPQEVLTAATTALITRSREEPETLPGIGNLSGAGLAELLVRLDGQFPGGDVGIFCTFVLNYITLLPGQAIFLSANVPHAYLSGDIVECMAASDNVVRAGFTPKFKDVDVLVDMLTYDTAPIEEQVLQPVGYKVTKNTVLYDPPIEEFSVLKTELQGGEKEVVPGIEGPSVLIVTGGAGWISVGPKREEVATGFVYFVGATAEVVVESGEGGIVVYRAFCEL